MAAGAALAAGTAEAQVVWSGTLNTSIALGTNFTFDVNNDTVGDIRFSNSSYSGGPYQGAFMPYAPGQLVGFRAGPSNFGYVTNLAPNTLISSANIGPTFVGSLAYGAANPNAQFNNANPGFVGFSFGAGGNTLFGWARVNINQAAGTFTVIDYAYQATPGVGINAGAIPEPGTIASLGFLAAGAAGLGIYRRRRQQAGA